MLSSDYYRRRAYVLCRPIFSGSDAQVRKTKKVKELVNKSKNSLEPLLRDIGKARLVEILRSLLENRIFESELRAKVEFPDLFRPSPLRHVQRQASEIDAARSVAEALDEIASQNGEGPGVMYTEVEEPLQEEAPDEEPVIVEDGRGPPVGMFLYMLACLIIVDLRACRTAGRKAAPTREAALALPLIRAVPGPASDSQHSPASSRRMLL